MTESRKKTITSIVDGIKIPHIDLNCKNIFILSGDFGTGKSWVTSMAESEISSLGETDAVLRLEQVREMGYLPEFLNNAILTFRAAFPDAHPFPGAETAYNMTRYLELLNQIKSKNPELFEDVLSSYILKSNADIYISDKFLNDSQIKNKITAEIIEHIEQKGDQRLLLDTSKVVAESFIVDLMTYFFDTEKDPHAYTDAMSGNKRKKIVFVVDNYELISGSINQWLFEEFFNYCFNKTFNEFTAYNITQIPAHLKVSDFFDFRFIIVSRKDLVASNEFSNLDKFRHLIERYTLKPLEISEMEEFVSETHYQYKSTLENLHAISHGIPYNILIWLEYFSLGNVESDNSLVYLKITETILKYCSEEQKDWIKCAAFLNEFDENALRCFSFIGESYSRAFSFFQNASDFCLPAKNNLKMIEVKLIIREFVKESVSLESFHVAKEYSKIARSYQEIKDIFVGLNAEEVNVVRNLAYFVNIDEPYGLEQTFQTDVEKARLFIKKYPGWFEKKNNSFSLKADIAEKLTKFNKMVDLEKFHDKLNLIGSIWEKQQKRLNDEILDCQASLPKLNQEIISLEKISNSHKSVYESNQKEFIQKENTLIELRKKLSAFSPRHAFLSSGVNFFAALIVFLISVYFPMFFGNPENQDSVQIVQYIMRFLTIVFGIIGCVYSIKGGMIASKKKELNELKQQIQETENEKQQFQDKMKEIRESKESSQRREIEIYEKLKEINKKIKENQEKLLEPYI